MKKRAGSVTSGTASGQTTPGTSNGGQSAGKQKTLNEQDLQRADEALSHREPSVFLVFFELLADPLPLPKDNGNSNGY